MNQSDNFIVNRAIAFIEENSSRKITLDDATNACYVSRWHLSKLLNKHLGNNFYALLNKARIEKAKKLMSDPSLRIGDISELVGFADPPHFSKVFKRIEGVSAKQYRNLKRLKL